MTTPTSLEETFEAINATARVISPNVSRVTIWHRDLISEETWLDAQFGVAGDKIGRQRRLPPEGGVRSVLRRGEPLWANNAASEPLLGEQFQPATVSSHALRCHYWSEPKGLASYF